MNQDAPQYPAGPFVPVEQVTDARRVQWIAAIAAMPRQLSQAVEGLSDSQLDTKYRNWTIRQIVHHLADSHMHSYIRFKWTLTEETPLIKAYDEGLWSNLPDARQQRVGPSLTLLDGLHGRWCQVLRAMTPLEFERRFLHPESNEHVSLGAALAYYAWHGNHHTGQIRWLLERVGS